VENDPVSAIFVLLERQLSNCILYLFKFFEKQSDCFVLTNILIFKVQFLRPPSREGM
jgi:hypothetical protein